MAVTIARKMEIEKMSYSQASQLSDEEFAVWAEHRSEQIQWELLDECETRTCIPQEY